MRISRAGIAGVLGSALLAGCLGPPSPTASLGPTPNPEVGVHVYCREEGCPDGRVLIEIGPTAWEAQDADGTALAPADSTVEVRIVDPDSCQVFAEFAAEPNGRYVVEVSAVGESTVVDTTAQGNVAFPMGPSTLPSSLSQCP